MTALTLMGYPFDGRPIYLALAPLTHAAGVLCFPVLALGGEVVIMRSPDVGGFLALVERHRVTHTFLPPTLIYMVLGAEALDATDLASLQCFWYGAAPMSRGPARGGADPDRAGDGSALRADRGADDDLDAAAGRPLPTRTATVATERLASAGRPAPLVSVAILDEDGAMLPGGERGEIVVRSSLVMAGYYKNPEATAEAGPSRLAPHRRHRLPRRRRLPLHRRPGQGHDHHRRLQRVLHRGRAGPARPSRRPGLRGDRVPDEKWGERVVAVVQPYAGRSADPDELAAS